jgi:phosphoribosyl 1,2-cyclic phosphodiesterase
MRLTVLGSGSRGNALVVETSGTRICVDAGFGRRALARRSKAARIPHDSISACIITHEHLDHSQGALAVNSKWHWPLIATPQTLAAVYADNAYRVTAAAYGQSVVVGNVRVTLLRVSHDAAEPAAVLVEDCTNGARIGIAYDLGYATDDLATAFQRLDLLVIEANHDSGMLRAGPYPPVLQERVAGPRGHLSNVQAARFAARVAHRGLRAIVLAHLSEQNNTPSLARASVAQALRATSFRGTLVAASQDSVCAVGDESSAQLRLF